MVVFKTPTTPYPTGTPWYTINYIKRLVGLPGEQLMLLDGDVYVRRSDTEPWTIQPKPKYAQDALLARYLRPRLPPAGTRSHRRLAIALGAQCR